jgi:hypothetical protein
VQTKLTGVLKGLIEKGDVFLVGDPFCMEIGEEAIAETTAAEIIGHAEFGNRKKRLAKEQTGPYLQNQVGQHIKVNPAF